MAHSTIVPFGDTAALLLPTHVLESAGLRIGDVVDVTLADNQLILQRVDDAERRQHVEEIVREVFDRRRDAYQRLA